jgi:hypothetical protein
VTCRATRKGSIERRSSTGGKGFNFLVTIRGTGGSCRRGGRAAMGEPWLPPRFCSRRWPANPRRGQTLRVGTEREGVCRRILEMAIDGGVFCGPVPSSLTRRYCSGQED